MYCTEFNFNMNTLIDNPSDVRILIFRTSILDEIDVRRAEYVLNNHHAIAKWSVDLDDWEHVLKVEASMDCTYEEISKKINLLGYECAEMDH